MWPSPSNNSTPPVLSSFFSNTVKSLNLLCFFSPHNIILFVFFITFILTFLPLCILVLHHGLHKWKQARSSSSAAAVSHSDCFTFHIVVMDLIGILGCTLLYGGIYGENVNTLCVGSVLWVYSWYGETSLHILTCTERYMAVVHPITYMKFKNQRGIRIRNMMVCWVWVLGVVGMASVMTNILFFLSMNLSFMILSLIAITFCSSSVLHVLIRPGPGEKPRWRDKVDPSKKRAFYTIVAILAALVLRFIGNLVWTLLFVTTAESECLLMVVMIWFTLPSSLMQPLLFLHRAGKLRCFMVKIK